MDDNVVLHSVAQQPYDLPTTVTVIIAIASLVFATQQVHLVSYHQVSFHPYEVLSYF